MTCKSHTWGVGGRQGIQIDSGQEGLGWAVSGESPTPTRPATPLPLCTKSLLGPGPGGPSVLCPLQRAKGPGSPSPSITSLACRMPLALWSTWSGGQAGGRWWGTSEGGKSEEQGRRGLGWLRKERGEPQSRPACRDGEPWATENLTTASLGATFQSATSCAQSSSCPGKAFCRSLRLLGPECPQAPLSSAATGGRHQPGGDWTTSHCWRWPHCLSGAPGQALCTPRPPRLITAESPGDGQSSSAAAREEEAGGLSQPEAPLWALPLLSPSPPSSPPQLPPRLSYLERGVHLVQAGPEGSLA